MVNKLYNLLDGYTHKHWELTVNKTKYEVNRLSMSVENIEWYNEVISTMKALGFKKGSVSEAGTISRSDVGNYYYIINRDRTVELIIKWIKGGIYRFVLGMQKKDKNNPISGTKALKIILKKAEEFGVLDVFESIKVSESEGIELNKSNEKPLILCCNNKYLGNTFDNVHHIDLNSSYASRICEEYESLRPMYEYLYNKRHENNDYYKHVLTNSIGAMHSKYCVDITGKRQPFAYTKLAQIAINGTNREIRKLYTRLLLEGYEPLLVNTDGIWYKGDMLEGETTEFGGWKIDHTNCKLYIKSAGAYQYIENGIVKSIVRGPSTLDMIKPNRDDWKWLEIKEYPVLKYKLEGDYIVWQDER